MGLGTTGRLSVMGETLKEDMTASHEPRRAQVLLLIIPIICSRPLAKSIVSHAFRQCSVR